MELINRMRKNRKGFTLVEIIVVLVILAILAAFTIPTMLGFVGDARGKAYIAEAREVYVAAQSTATEYSAKLGLNDLELSTALGSVKVKTNDTGDVGKASAQMSKYIGEDLLISGSAIPTDAATVTSFGKIDSAWTVTVGANTATSKTAQVKNLVYYKNGYKVTIDNGSATVVKVP